jgi:Fic family protein
MHITMRFQIRCAEADRLVGKLDGLLSALPDADFFVPMFVAKEAAASSRLEGTQATLAEAVEYLAGVADPQTDASDIVANIRALNFGLARLADLPLSMRLIGEVHAALMAGASSSPMPKTKRACGELDKVLRDRRSAPPLVQAAMAHAQFETIRPFLDGNGRTGRLLITLMFAQRGLLEQPALGLSSYFLRHQAAYHRHLRGYHRGEVLPWLEFFLDGVIESAKEAIAICGQVARRREMDLGTVTALARREAISGATILQHLLAQPVTTTRLVRQWTGFTRAGAQRALDRLVALDILAPAPHATRREQAYAYRKYLEIFE